MKKNSKSSKSISEKPPNHVRKDLELQQQPVYEEIKKIHQQELPNGNGHTKLRKWREWHEREIPVKVKGRLTTSGMKMEIVSSIFKKKLLLRYPPAIWKRYPKENKIKLLDNINYIFTAHLPFLLKENIRLEYNTGYPHVYSWASQGFMRYLPAYWYLYNGKRGTKIFPMLKTLLNSNVEFSETIDAPPSFPATIDEHVIIPFTFGKDSLLTYNIAKEIGLKPTIIWFNDPGGFEGKHKKRLFREFSKIAKDKIYFIDNAFEKLREQGDGWFGWELAMTSWALLTLPFAYAKKAGYIIYSNEKSANSFFYDESGVKIIPDYEQSGQATEELSILTQALSEGEVYTTTFSQGLHELAIIGILKQKYFDKTFRYLMSCWSENEDGKNKRWCGNCSKCARIYVYMTAHGVRPQEDAGFEDNMFLPEKEPLFNVFGKNASGTGWDAFGLNTDEQALAFYLTYLRGNRDPLVQKFAQTEIFLNTKKRYDELMDEYLTLHKEYITPPQWKRKINRIFNQALLKVRKEIIRLP